MAERKRTAIKICGVTTPEDAALAAGAGADFVGMILWRGSKRGVTPIQAAAIVDVVRQNGVEPVGVFVEGGAGEIAEICRRSGIRTVQLHGGEAREAHPELPGEFRRIWAVDVSRHGRPETAVPESLDPHRDWLLYDSAGGGTGRSFDWDRFTPQRGFSWLLAGGLSPETVGGALAACDPSGVDVSSGVADRGGIAKDPEKIRAFIRAVRERED
jgi:phosphoribosylanthranilate isomerase